MLLYVLSGVLLLLPWPEGKDVGFIYSCGDNESPIEFGTFPKCDFPLTLSLQLHYFCVIREMSKTWS
jgi:hypothetical protein